MKSPLHIAAGPKALRHLQENGLQLADIRAMLGASGGPKWLVLNQLDRFLAPRLAADTQVDVDLLGTSIGSWRFACYAQPDPLAAFDRFESAYFEQAYTAKPDAREISLECSRILEAILGEQHAAIVNSEKRRLHTIANRCRPAMLDRHNEPGKFQLGASALANAAGRKYLKHFFERILFAPAASKLPFQESMFPQENVRLNTGNLQQALMATASIPLLMEAVHDIAGTSGGTCVDGGIIDYHFDTPLPYDNGIVLYLHFSPRLIPGWFDKMLPWRKPRAASMDNVLLITPSQKFIAGLPNGRIPDRHDFVQMDDGQRTAVWRKVLAETERLAEELAQKLERQQWKNVVELV
ncbi:MAG TPA: alpha/beta hydrolase [Moraxellaceae bacterium]|nr:alpha/beta hydrolase [Moraxellaceae bacterium]